MDFPYILNIFNTYIFILNTFLPKTAPVSRQRRLRQLLCNDKKKIVIPHTYISSGKAWRVQNTPPVRTSCTHRQRR